MLAAGLLVGLGLGTAIFFGFTHESDGPSGERAASAAERAGSQVAPYLPAPVEGSPAPDFELIDLEGNTQRLSDLRGSVVLLNFWATWCSPCEVEMPVLDAAYQRYRDQGLVVLAVNFDETEAEVRAFRDRMDLSFPVVLDPGGQVQQLYRVRGYPTSFLVDRDGVIQVEHIGIMSEDNVNAYLTDLGLSQQ